MSPRITRFASQILTYLIILASIASSTVIHITDIHFDQYFQAHTSEWDHCHRGDIPPLAGKFGGRFCDAPEALVDSLGAFIAESSDLNNPSTVVWTGDAVRHDADSKRPVDEEEHWTIQQRVASWFNEWWPGVPVVISIGNNDIYPHDKLPAGPNEVLGNISKAFERYFNSEQRIAFEKGGYYAAGRFISLNSIYFAKFNSAISGCGVGSPGYDQLMWLNDTLCSAMDKGYTIVSHVPPGSDSWYDSCNTLFDQIVQEHSEILLPMWFGHTHDDHFQLIGDDGVVLVAPSVVPQYNMAVRVFVDDLSDYHQYFGHLDTANEHGTIEWMLEYAATDAYGVNVSSIDDWHTLNEKMKSDPFCREHQLYEEHKHVSIGM